MRVISRKHLNNLAKRYPESKAEVDAWFHEAEAAIWATPAEIKQHYGNASILNQSRVVFNISGKQISYCGKNKLPHSVLYVRFAGSHKECDTINAQEI